MATTLSSGERLPWFFMSASEADRDRSRPVPVAEIIEVQKELEAAQKRIAALEQKVRELRREK